MGKIVKIPRCEWCNKVGAWKCKECGKWTCENCFHGYYDVDQVVGPLCIHMRYDEAEDEMDWIVNREYHDVKDNNIKRLKDDEYRK